MNRQDNKDGKKGSSGKPGKKIVFDFGGVLFRWQPVAMLQREIPHLASDPARAAHWVREIFQGYEGDWAQFDCGLVAVPELIARISRRTGLTAADLQRVVDGVPRELQPIPQTVALLERLRNAGHTLFFLSNMPAPYADHLEAEHDFVRWFHDGIFSGRVQRIKPAADIFELAARHFRSRPEELVFLDDHAPNIAMARSLGWQALQFVDAAQAEQEMRERGWVGE